MKNKFINTLFISLSAFLLGNAVQAQEWQVEATGNFVQQQGSKSIPMSKSSEGFSLGVGYNFYLSNNWSLGLGVSYLRTELSFSEYNLHGNSTETDIDGDSFDFRYKTKSFNESVRWESFRIPLTVQYETNGDVRWYVRTGVLYGLQAGKSKYRQDWRDFSSSGYYPQWDAELHGPNYVGFGKMGNVHNEGTVKLRNTFSWLFETGIKQKLRETNNLYLGMFVEVGLNDMRPETDADKNAVEYTQNVNEPLKFNSILNQSKYKNDKISTLMIGFKIKYSFEFKK